MPAIDKRAAYALFALVVLTTACGNLSQTAVNAMMMGIVADMGVTVELGQWLSTGYMLMLGVAVPAVTWISKRFSARQHVLLGMGLSLAGSLICLAAPCFWVLLAGRVLQAVSTGILLPFMTTIAMVSFPPGRQATAMGIAGVAMGFAPNIGPTVGGAMASAWGWRSFFVLLTALTCLLAVCALALVKPSKPHDAVARLDAVSLSLSTLGLGGVLLGFSNASSFALISPYVWGPLVVGAALCAAFVVRQKRLDNPLIDLGVFRSRRFSAGFAAQNLLFASFMGVTLVVPLYVEGLCGGTALQAGMVLLPGTVAALVLNPLGGVLTDRIGARRVCLVGGLMLSAGAVPMCFLDAASPLWQAVVFQGVRACGVSLLIGPLTQWSLADLPRPLVPHGSSLSIAVRQACASFGTSAMVLAISAGQGIASRGWLTGGLQAAPDALAALPYHLAFGFSAVLSLCLFAAIARKVR